MEMETEQAAKPKPRIESLSDLIFGLALSIGAIALVSSPPNTVRSLYADMLTFAFSFVILISVWLRYTRIMSVLPLETRRTILLNILLLFSVSMEPFLFNILRSGNSATPAAAGLLGAATALYGVDLGVISSIMGLFTSVLADEERKLVPKEMMQQLRSEAVSWFVGGAIFLVSAAPFFGRILIDGTLLRTDLWIAALVVVWLRRNMRKFLAGKG